MLKRPIKLLIILCLSIVFTGSMAMAQDNDQGQSGDNPPGWDKGKKEGWKSDVPPGQEEKEKNKKADNTGKIKASEGEKLEKEKKEEKEKREKKEKRQKGEKKKKKAKKSKK